MVQIKKLFKPLEAKKHLKHFLSRKIQSSDGSFLVDDRAIIESFEANRNNPFLVSFPRTGSHWLRMLMELYFGRPSLVRIFYFPDRKDYLTLHTHDLDLKIERESVIYLYREPVDTIYSQLQYHQEDIDDRDRIKYWCDLYGRHLSKWLHFENFSKRKTIISYEALKNDIYNEFRKICHHLDMEFENQKLQITIDRVTKEHVNKKSRHDPKVINLSNRYNLDRQRFRDKQGSFIWEYLLQGKEDLKQHFKPYDS